MRDGLFDSALYIASVGKLHYSYLISLADRHSPNPVLWCFEQACICVNRHKEGNKYSSSFEFGSDIDTSRPFRIEFCAYSRV